MTWSSSFLQRWNSSHHHGHRDHSQRVRHRNGYGGGIGHYKPQGGSAWGPTPGASFSYNQSPQGNTGPNQPGTNPRPPAQGQNPFQAPRWANLENNLPLPQGYQRRHAMPTSVSSTITSLLYQSRQNPMDVWASQMQGGSQPRSTNQSYQGGTSHASYGGAQTQNTRYPTAPRPTPSGGTGSGAPPLMSQSSYDALRLADAYFSPKRLELAYQLGDMETDMQRLAVNLGRQIDDPILQAKLYKEAMKGVRTLDSDQNSFAIQMLEQRRKEEVANTQFYDQLSLEQDKMQQQDDQFYANLEQQRRQVNLQAYQTYNNPQLRQGSYGGSYQQGGMVYR